MSGHIQTTIVCYMTPNDLREIADTMERRWKEMTWGETTAIKTWFLNNTTQIEFHVDQDRAAKQMGPWGGGDNAER